jgi:hypothetical protein
MMRVADVAFELSGATVAELSALESVTRLLV